MWWRFVQLELLLKDVQNGQHIIIEQFTKSILENEVELALACASTTFAAYKRRCEYQYTTTTTHKQYFVLAAQHLVNCQCVQVSFALVFAGHCLCRR